MLNESFVQFIESEEQFGKREKFKLLIASSALSNTFFELSVNIFLKHFWWSLQLAHEWP